MRYVVHPRKLAKNAVSRCFALTEDGSRFFQGTYGIDTVSVKIDDKFVNFVIVAYTPYLVAKRSEVKVSIQLFRSVYVEGDVGVTRHPVTSTYLSFRVPTQVMGYTSIDGIGKLRKALVRVVDRRYVNRLMDRILRTIMLMEPVNHFLWAVTIHGMYRDRFVECITDVADYERIGDIDVICFDDIGNLYVFDVKYGYHDYGSISDYFKSIGYYPFNLFVISKEGERMWVSAPGAGVVISRSYGSMLVCKKISILPTDPRRRKKIFITRYLSTRFNII